MKGGKDDRLKPDRSSKYDNNHVHGFFYHKRHYCIVRIISHTTF